LWIKQKTNHNEKTQKPLKKGKDQLKTNPRNNKMGQKKKKKTQQNNEFSLKYRILIQEPKEKFLLYFTCPKPEIQDNWLADLLLANTEIKIDPISMILAELGWGREYLDVVKEHEYFFKSAKRISAIKKIHNKKESIPRTRWMMLGVLTSTEARWDEVLMSLFEELARGTTEQFDLIKKCGLDSWLWAQIHKLLGYKNKPATIKDLCLEMFGAAYNSALDKAHSLDQEAIYLLKRFKDHVRYRKAFRELSRQCSEWLGIEQDLQLRDLKDITEIDYFELIEQKILSELTQSIGRETIGLIEVERTIRRRMLSHWYDDYSHEYSALESAVNLRHLMNTLDISVYSFDEGIQKYLNQFYKLDFQYRKFIYHYQKAKQPKLLNELYEDIENRYLNSYLFPLSIAFAGQIKNMESYKSHIIPLQSEFWKKEISPYLEANKKIFVIISDALRYEIGSELMSQIRQEDRYEAELGACLGVLPSYTQLGMAALLPHKQISITPDASVEVDGISSKGSEYRRKILNLHTKDRALLLKASDVLSKNADESKKLYRDYDVIYVYQNRIDALGDDLTTESQVFEAVESAIVEIIEILRKLTSGNANNIVITADHGFLYQHRALADSDFLSDSDVSGNVLYRHRRFILGTGLKSNSALMHFSSKQLGLHGNIEVMLPLANQRMKRQGSGSRYVHGGASLQEIVVPIIRVNKKRVSDVEFVEVDILSTSGRIISTGQLVVKLYQRYPINDKLQPVTLRVGIYSQSGELISEEKTINFDYSSDNPRDREFQCSLVLSTKAEQANNQQIVLKLEKPIPGTNKYQFYKSETYT
jgi:uncharacterized protein (TIGR02687 family)